MKRLSPEKLRELQIILKALWDAVTAEPVPQSMHDQIKGLK